MDKAKEFRIIYNYRNCFSETFQNNYITNSTSKKSATNELENDCKLQGITLLSFIVVEIK